MIKNNPLKSEFQQPLFPDEEQISLGDLILTLAKHIKMIVVIPSLLCILVIVDVTFFRGHTYTSTSKIMSSSEVNRVSQAAGLAAQFGINLPSGQDGPKWVYPEIIKSRTLARSLLKRKFDTIEFGPQKTLLHILTNKNNSSEVSTYALEASAVNKLNKMISLSEDSKTSIITLSISASEPKLSKDINDVLIEELDTHQRSYNKSKTSDAKRFVTERINDTEKELIAVEEALKIFKDRNRRIGNSPALQLEQQRLEREVTVLTGVFTTLKQQLETIKIEEVKKSDYVVVLDPPEIPLERSAPKKKQEVIFAGVVGISIGLILGYIKEYSDTRDKEEKKKFIKSKDLIINNILDIFSKR